MDEFESSPEALALAAKLDAARPDIAPTGPLAASKPKRTRMPKAKVDVKAKVDRVPARIVVLAFLRKIGAFALASEIANGTDGAVTIRSAREAAHRLVNEKLLVMVTNLACEEGTITYRFALPGTPTTAFYGDGEDGDGEDGVEIEEAEEIAA